MSEIIGNMFFDHFETHSNCLGSLIIFYKLIYFSDLMLETMKKTHFISLFVEFLEKNIIQMLKDYESKERIEVIKDKVFKQAPTIGGKPTIDFQSNLQKLINNLYNINSGATSEGNKASPFEKSSPFKDFETEKGKFDKSFSDANQNFEGKSNFGSQNAHNQQGGILGNSENNSFAIYSKNMKVPMLQIPSNINENQTVISRSARRVDAHKSFSTTSKLKIKEFYLIFNLLNI